MPSSARFSPVPCGRPVLYDALAKVRHFWENRASGRRESLLAEGGVLALRSSDGLGREMAGKLQKPL